MGIECRCTVTMLAFQDRATATTTQIGAGVYMVSVCVARESLSLIHTHVSARMSIRETVVRWHHLLTLLEQQHQPL